MKRKNGNLIISSKDSYVRIRKNEKTANYEISYRNCFGHWTKINFPYSGLDLCKKQAYAKFVELEEIARTMPKRKNVFEQYGLLIATDSKIHAKQMAYIMHMRSKVRAIRQAQYMQYVSTYRRNHQKRAFPVTTKNTRPLHDLESIFKKASKFVEKKTRKNNNLENS